MTIFLTLVVYVIVALLVSVAFTVHFAKYPLDANDDWGWKGSTAFFSVFWPCTFIAFVLIFLFTEILSPIFRVICKPWVKLYDKVRND